MNERQLLRHFLAALAYRTQKALRGAPDGYPDFRAGHGLRTPHEILWHMTSVLGYARPHCGGGEHGPRILEEFPREVERCHGMLADLSRQLESNAPLLGTTPARLLQGPLADAMTHAGQLAMLRRLAGSPIPPENFIGAAIEAENVGPEQPEPVSPDEAWYDAEEEPQ